MQTTNKQARCLLAALALVAGANTQAQEDRWFRVELLVFARGAAGTGAVPGLMAERWEPTPTLTYPDTARFLVNPQQVAATAAQYPADSTVDEFGRQVLTLLPPPGERDESIEWDGSGQQEMVELVSEMAAESVSEPSQDSLEEITAGAGVTAPTEAAEVPPPAPRPS